MFECIIWEKDEQMAAASFMGNVNTVYWTGIIPVVLFVWDKVHGVMAMNGLIYA